MLEESSQRAHADAADARAALAAAHASAAAAAAAEAERTAAAAARMAAELGGAQALAWLGPGGSAWGTGHAVCV